MVQIFLIRTQSGISSIVSMVVLGTLPGFGV